MKGEVAIAPLVGIEEPAGWTYETPRYSSNNPPAKPGAFMV